MGWNPTTLVNSNGGTTWDPTNPPPGSPPDPDEWLITPCPAGWRLPTQLEYADLATTYLVGGSMDRLKSMDGRFFDSGDPTQPLLFLPAAGRRVTSGGLLTNVGTTGFYWSSTQFTTNSAYGLYFYSTDVIPSLSNNQSSGFTIRCVAEL